MPYVEKYNSATIRHDLDEGRTGTRVCDQVPYATWNTAWVSLRDAHPADATMLCYALEMKPQGKTSASAYDKVQVTAYYRVPKPGEWSPEDPYPSEQSSTVDIDFGVHAVSIQGNSGNVYTIDDNLNKINVANACLYIPIVTIAVNHTTGSILTDIQDIVGRVNDNVIRIPKTTGFIFSAEQVIYDGCKARNEINPEDTSSVIYYYTHQFRCLCHDEATWNTVPLSYGAGYDPMMEWEPLYPKLFEDVSFDAFLAQIGQGA